MSHAIVVDCTEDGYRQRVSEYLGRARREAMDRSGRIILSARPFVPPRTAKQNRRMWSFLGDLASQVCWHGEWLTKEEWKDLITAGLKRQRAVPGIDGGFVVLGARTSEMSRREMAEVIEFCIWFGSEQDVVWTLPPKDEEWEGVDRRRAAA